MSEKTPQKKLKVAAGASKPPKIEPPIHRAAQPPFEGAQYEYGAWWKPTDNQLRRELISFRIGPERMVGSPGRAEHFWNAVEILWGPTNRKKRFIRHPWAERMTEVACGEMRNSKSFVGVVGGAGCGKTEWAAVWAIINFLCMPERTTVLVTSTSLKDSRKRIFGSIKEYWLGMPGRGPGKLVDSQGLIRYDVGGKATVGSDKSGISLIAADKSKDKEAYAKMIGFHNERVLLIGDELPELGESILGAAYSNLAQNPFFQLIGIGNPSSYYDPLGQFVKPKAGWTSISLESEEWQTERGVCVRFDGLKSPNILAGRTLYPFLMTRSFYDEQKVQLGENSYGFYRMCRGFFSPAGVVEGIYSESDIIKFRADIPTVWLRPPVSVAALDPAFTNGGDRTALYFGKYGDNSDGIKTLCFERVEMLAEDLTDKDTPRSFQIVKLFKDKCAEFGVSPENACFDVTGAGKPFGDIVAREWSPRVMRIDFNGKASERPASVSDSTPASDRYTNRVTELWFGAKELLRTGQLKGIGSELGKEMCARTFTTIKGETTRLKAEPKPDMRMRTGFSPDIADAALMLVELCRENFGFGADEAIERGVSGRNQPSMAQMMTHLNQVNYGRTLY